MGLFSFLKREKKAEAIEIRLDKVPSWIEGRKKGLLVKLNRELSLAREKINDEKMKFRANVECLSSTLPGNDKIPERAKQIREDNRRSYAQKVSALVKSVEIPEDISKIPEFFIDYDKALKEFSGSTLRNYSILKEFFANETDAVVANIRDLDSAVRSARKAVKDSGIDRIADLKRLAESVRNDVQRREKLGERISTAEDEMREAHESELACERRIKEIKESSEYKVFIDLIENRKMREQEVRGNERALHHSFSVIEAALKKYERLTLEDALVQKYLEDPLKALLEDSELKIVEFAEKMKASIADGSLELKEAKKDKILSELDGMTRKRFESFISGFHKLQERIRGFKLKIEAAEIRELHELREKLSGLTTKAEACRNQVSHLSKDLSSIDAGKLNGKLSEKIEEITGERVSVG